MPDTPTPQAPQTPNATTGSGTNLSDKLARSDGVLCPPNVDPEIKAPTPEVGNDAGDPAARQPRRRPERAAEIERTRNIRRSEPLSGPYGRRQNTSDEFTRNSTIGAIRKRMDTRRSIFTAMS